jgi:pimeloyl-ACP methyl ester carboxylesterase
MTTLRPASSTPRFHHEFVSTGELRLHYAEVLTESRPMLLLHGIGMDWRVWQALSRRLAPYFHLYLLDLRGHGQSDKPAHGYTLAHYAADVEDLIDRLELTDAVVVGSSLGGMVAATIEAPSDMVSHRVLVDPPLTGGPIRDAEMFQAILALKHEPARVLANYLQTFNPGAGRHYLHMMSEMWHEAADGVIEDMLASPDDYYAVGDHLRHIEAPTLLLQADPALGGVLSTEEAERALALLPHGQQIEVPGAGHAIHAYKPAEFVQIVSAFVGK